MEVEDSEATEEAVGKKLVNTSLELATLA